MFLVVLVCLAYVVSVDAIRIRVDAICIMWISYMRHHLTEVGVRWNEVQPDVTVGLSAQQVRYLRKSFTSVRIAYARYTLKRDFRLVLGVVGLLISFIFLVILMVNKIGNILFVDWIAILAFLIALSISLGPITKLSRVLKYLLLVALASMGLYLAQMKQIDVLDILTTHLPTITPGMPIVNIRVSEKVNIVMLAVVPSIYLLLSTASSLVKVSFVVMQYRILRSTLKAPDAALLVCRVMSRIKDRHVRMSPKCEASTLGDLRTAERLLRRGVANTDISLDSTERSVVERRLLLAANVLQSYRIWLLLPGRTTYADLHARISLIAQALLLGYWNDLPVNLIEVSNRWNRVMRTVLGVGRQLLIAALPGSFLLGAKYLGVDLSRELGQVLTLVAVIWATVTVMGIVDPALNSRITVFRDIFSLFSRSDKK